MESQLKKHLGIAAIGVVFFIILLNMLSTNTFLESIGADNTSPNVGTETQGDYFKDLDLILEEIAPGVSVIDFDEGTGEEAKVGDTVSIQYVGHLVDGTEFDKSDGNPFSFVIGSDSIIEGFSTGIIGMKEGGLRLMKLDPSVAYGNQAVGVIPSNSTLYFFITLQTIN